MPKSLAAMDAVNYKFRGQPAYLLSEEEYARFLEMITDWDSATTLFTETLDLAAMTEDTITIDLTAYTEKRLLRVMIDADGLGRTEILSGADMIGSMRNSQTSWGMELNQPIYLTDNTLTVKVANRSIFGNANSYRVYVYLHAI